MAGLPDPEHDRQFYTGVPLRRLVAWFDRPRDHPRRWRPASALLRSCDPRLRLLLFPLIVAGVGFLYRTATLAGASATWGMRFVGIELRRGDGTRFDLLTAVLHTALYTVCFQRGRAAVRKLPHHPRLPIRPEPARHRSRHHRHQPSGRLNRPGRSLRAGESCCRPGGPVATLGGQGGTTGPRMRHTLPQSHQFYVTAPQPCPYLPGKVERKLFTALQGDGACHLNDVLSHQGFRRSQNVLYRPSCAGCSACLSARIVVSGFAPSRGQRRVLRRNIGLERVARSPWATEAQYHLFRRYLDARHATGGMADMDMSEFAAMIEEIPGSQPGHRVLPPAPRRAAAPARSGLPDRRALGRGVDGLFLLRPRPRSATASATSSSSTMSPWPRSRTCPTSTLATGCRAARR